MCTHNRHNIIVFNAHHIQRWWPFMHAFTAQHFHTLLNWIFMRNVPTVWIVCLCISSLSRMMCPVERFHQTTRVPIKCSSLHQFFGFFLSLTCHLLSSFTHNAPLYRFLYSRFQSIRLFCKTKSSNVWRVKRKKYSWHRHKKHFWIHWSTWHFEHCTTCHFRMPLDEI